MRWAAIGSLRPASSMDRSTLRRKGAARAIDALGSGCFFCAMLGRFCAQDVRVRPPA